MYSRAIEAKYPLEYRKQDATLLGNHLGHRHSVTVFGMKRVGISNFLRFFLSHEKVLSTYVQGKETHHFIVVDLNDLVEREIFPFWTLTLKRIVDSIEDTKISAKDKKKIEALFLKAIQVQDHLTAIDSVRQAFVMLIELGFLPTLFLVHFDRIKEVVSPSFFDNLEGLMNATGNKLSYVFTSYRRLEELSPAVFSQISLPFFSQNMVLYLAKRDDMETIFHAYNNRYKLTLQPKLKESLFDLVNGHIQYLQLSLLILQENEKHSPTTAHELLNLLLQDERITLQSEELWDSLADKEREILLKVLRKETINERDTKEGVYLWDTGFIQNIQGKPQLFSQLFATYIEQMLIHTPTQPQSVHFSKKELVLYQLLEQHVNEICERDEIVNIVWPEYSEVGISDWAIDRLVARVRTKLRQQESKFEIKTIRTRGYQLVEK